MNIIISLADAGIIIFVYMTSWFLYSVIVKRNDVADIAWGLGFVFVSISALLITGNYSVISLMVLILVSLWGLRLSYHIGIRNTKKLEEDVRYKNWRESWGKKFYLRSFFQVFMLQGLLMLLVSSAAIITILKGSNDLNFWVFLGFLIWLKGFFFEVLGDYQLKKFLTNKNNKDKIMNKGLWKYTRHPNYFGEVVMWWGIWLISISTGYWLLTIVSPITISIIILFISGIPMTEKLFENKPGWQEYKEKTSIFWPLPPKKL